MVVNIDSRSLVFEHLVATHNKLTRPEVTTTLPKSRLEDHFSISFEVNCVFFEEWKIPYNLTYLNVY